MENFWIENPDLKYVGRTKVLYDEDKSKSKDKSSKLMWCIYLIWDRRSLYYNLPEEGKDNKIDLVFNDIYPEGKNYIKEDKNVLEELRAFYLMLKETPAQRALTGVEEKLMERDIFLKGTKYDLGEVDDRTGKYVGGTAELLDKMLANTVKMWDLYDKARKIVAQETETTSLGNREESLSDKQLI